MLTHRFFVDNLVSAVSLPCWKTRCFLLLGRAQQLQRERCQWLEVDKSTRQASTGVKAVNGELGDVKTVFQKGWMGGGCKEVGRVIWERMWCNMEEIQETEQRHSIICGNDGPGPFTGHQSLPGLQQVWMLPMQCSSISRDPGLLNLQFPLQNPSSYSGLCLVEDPVQFTAPSLFQ